MMSITFEDKVPMNMIRRLPILALWFGEHALKAGFGRLAANGQQKPIRTSSSHAEMVNDAGFNLGIVVKSLVGLRI